MLIILLNVRLEELTLALPHMPWHSDLIVRIFKWGHMLRSFQLISERLNQSIPPRFRPYFSGNLDHSTLDRLNRHCVHEMSPGYHYFCHPCRVFKDPGLCHWVRIYLYVIAVVGGFLSYICKR